MKLDSDCVRDVLLVLEEGLTLQDDLRYGDIHIELFVVNPKLSHYDPKTIAYTVYKLAEAGYIDAGKFYLSVKNGGYFIRSLTYQGHDFLESIRDEKIWRNTKSILSKVGTFALSIIRVTAEGIATAYLNKQLGAISAANPS